MRLNPRFVGQVFRLEAGSYQIGAKGLNPRFVGQVFRPTITRTKPTGSSLNPRFVGQVFRLQPVKNSSCFQSLKRCILDSKFFNYQKHCLTKS